MDGSHSGDEQRRSAAGDVREGFGDDGGARVGRPDPSRGAEQGAGRDDEGHSLGPSSRPVKEGLEGSILGDDAGETKDRARTGETSAGSEAARGLHEAGSGNEPSGDDESHGSEPLKERSREHETNYGGKMGEPRKG